MTLNCQNQYEINNPPLWHDCQKHLTIHDESNLFKYNIHFVWHIYKTSKMFKILCKTLYLKICNSPWVDVPLLYPKLLMLDLFHVDFDTLYLCLALSFFLYLLYSNSPFHISSLVVIVSFWLFYFSPLKFISPFLTLMSKGTRC